MLNKIISYSLHNRLLILFAAILLFFIGSYTAMKMEVDVFPDLNAYGRNYDRSSGHGS